MALAPTAAQAADPVISPEVLHTRTGPTGYSVTFRYVDPTATSIRIKGEWSFSNAADIAADPTNANARTGDTWQPGDFPVPSPLVGSTSNWPVSEMVKDPATGVWEFTTALPSGTFNYWFYKDCTAPAPAMTGCTALYDPLNQPWDLNGTIQRTSQVYVPSDAAFGTVDNSWQSSDAASAHGKLTHATYNSPGHVAPTDKNYVSVYTPPGYNANRAEPYPTFYLNHGGGGNEMDWSTQGTLDEIMDNLISSGEIQPMVVVMPNNPTTITDVRDNLITFVEQRYNVITDPSGRALAGLSGGGTVVQDVLFHSTTTFGYYGVWSVPRGLPTAGEEKNPELKQLLGLHLAIGTQDLGGLAQGNTTAEQALLRDAGVPFESFNVDGAHTWSFWRETVRDFLTRVAFPKADVPPPVTDTVPEITKQPAASTTVSAGSLVTLSAAATGSPAPTVTWQVSKNAGASWSSIAKADWNAYSFIATTALSGNRYRAAFTNSAGTTYSAVSKLTVKTVTKSAVKLASKTVSSSKKAVVTITVSPTASKPTGTVTVHYGSKTKTVSLTSGKKGKVSVTLPKLKKGEYTIYANFNGSTNFKTSTSSKVTLTVK